MIRLLLALLALALAAPAYSLNMTGLKDAPITRLDKEELQLYRVFIMKALDEAPDGATLEWKAPKTRFDGKITPRKTYEDGKLKCREAVIESDAHDRAARGTYNFCKGAKGDWQFRSPRPAKK
jgi:surface antigen